MIDFGQVQRSQRRVNMEDAGCEGPTVRLERWPSVYDAVDAEIKTNGGKSMHLDEELICEGFSALEDEMNQLSIPVPTE